MLYKNLNKCKIYFLQSYFLKQKIAKTFPNNICHFNMNIEFIIIY